MGSLRTNAHVHPGWSIPSRIVPGPIVGGSEKPRRTSRSRRPNTAVSTVRTSASYPAAAARSTISRDQPPVTPRVDLEPEPAVAHGAHLLDRACAERRQRVRQTGASSGPRDGELAVGIGDAGETGRRENQREGDGSTEDRSAGVDLLDAPQHAWAERRPRRTRLRWPRACARPRRHRRCSRTRRPAAGAGRAGGGRRPRRPGRGGARPDPSRPARSERPSAACGTGSPAAPARFLAISRGLGHDRVHHADGTRGNSGTMGHMSGDRVGIPHVAALDGLRGLAVAGVLLFHGGHLSGGYLGVDLFFVLSGFLITTLLLVESSSRGRVALGSFWARRARRLLPAIAGVLVGVALYCVVFVEPGRARTDPRRRPGHRRVRRELASCLLPPGLLGTVPVSVTAATHVVAGDRGAVLPRVATGLRRARGVAGPQDAGRRARGRARGRGIVDDPHGLALRSRQPGTRVLRDRHAGGRDLRRRRPGRGPRDLGLRAGPWWSTRSSRSRASPVSGSWRSGGPR